MSDLLENLGTFRHYDTKVKQKNSRNGWKMLVSHAVVGAFGEAYQLPHDSSLFFRIELSTLWQWHFAILTVELTDG